MSAQLLLGIILVIIVMDLGRGWYPRGFWLLPGVHPFSLLLGLAVGLTMWGVVLAAS